MGGGSGGGGGAGEGTCPNDLDGRVIGATGSRLRAPSLSGYGKALVLHGDDHQYVGLPQSTVLDIVAYTITAWVRYSGLESDLTRGRREVMEKAASYWMNVRTEGHVRVGGFYAGCSGPGVWQYLDSPATIRSGRWTHLAAQLRRRDAEPVRRRPPGGLEAGDRVSLRQRSAAGGRCEEHRVHRRV